MSFAEPEPMNEAQAAPEKPATVQNEPSGSKRGKKRVRHCVFSKPIFLVAVPT